MFVLGVTGGLGTGKSTVAKIFGALGATVLDADRITHALYRPGTPVFRKVRARFGKEILTPSGTIDRKRLGQRVFHNPRDLSALCRIVHPEVRRKIQEQLRRLAAKDPAAVAVLDVPLLMEAKEAYPVDAQVVVSAPLAVVSERLNRRSGWSLAEVKRRSGFQMPLKEKERQADFVVRNAGSLHSTRRQVKEIWKRIIEA